MRSSPRLARGDRVELRGFGAFSVKHRPARAGRNPRTGAHVPVDQKSVPFFKTGKEMRERLNRDRVGAGARRFHRAYLKPTPVCWTCDLDQQREMVMRKFLNALVLIPLGLIFIVFAVANRHLVTVSLDPFNSSDPVARVDPAAFRRHHRRGDRGVVAGGSATWFRQRRWRRAARQHEADARQARAQLADLRGGAAMPPRHDPQRLPGPSQGGGYGAGGRDKQGATL